MILFSNHKDEIAVFRTQIRLHKVRIIGSLRQPDEQPFPEWIWDHSDLGLGMIAGLRPEDKINVVEMLDKLNDFDGYRSDGDMIERWNTIIRKGEQR